MNVMQEIAEAINEACYGFSDTTSHRDMFRRVADAIEARARKHPDFNQGADLLNKIAPK